MTFHPAKSLTFLPPGVSPDPIGITDPCEPARRYIIASDGRAGSTLIAAILAAAGGDFGMKPVENWNPLGGAHELPGLDRLNRALEQAQYVTELAEKFPGLRLLARALRSIAKRKLRRAATQSVFFKSSPLAAAYLFKLGLSPQTIAVYRDFGDLARSKMLLERMPWPNIANRALLTYRNALIAIHTFGGCAISYEEMIDPRQTAWLDALADCTGLDREALLLARARIVRPIGRAPNRRENFNLDDRLEPLERDLRSLRGRYLPPSASYLRAAAAARR